MEACDFLQLIGEIEANNTRGQLDGQEAKKREKLLGFEETHL